MNRTALILSFLSVGCAFLVVVLGYKTGLAPLPGQTPKASWTPLQQRELANRLKGSGINLQAIKAYEQYVRSAALDGTELANLSYTIGSMYLDAGRYEDALAWLYRVELADPDTPLKTEVGSKIINCLERVGRHSAAEYALSRRAAGRDGTGMQGRTVVAEISGEKIYLDELNAALDVMPEWMRTQFAGKEHKAQFLKKYVADELLVRKAVKLEYDKDPAVRTQLEMLKRELLVNKIVEDELKDKIKIEADDLKNFFEARKSDYAEKEAVKVLLIKAGMEEIAETIVAKLKAGEPFAALAREVSLDKPTAENGGAFPRWVRKGEDDLGIGNREEVSRVLFAAQPGDITPAVEAGGYYYIFRIEEHRPERMPEFAEVSERVKNDYFMQKLKASYQDLLDRTLQNAQVTLYPEALAEEGPP